MTPLGRPRLRFAPPVDPQQRIRDLACVQLRSGLLDDHAVVLGLTEVAAAELEGIDAASFAERLVADVRKALSAEQEHWPDCTDYTRLQAAFRQLERVGIVVLQGVEDHWSTTAELRRLDGDGRCPRGIAWFTAPDVWHAVDHGMLEVNVWHADTANVAPGDELLAEVLAAFAAHGLSAHFDEGRVEVAAYWQRRV
ncbi:MAG: hypothetical protein M3P83_02705 [Actinomycetota bacterium]|nr:hypothetical protein [Actinomycetota bacterium]